MPDLIDPGLLDPNETEKVLPDGKTMKYEIFVPLTPLQEAEAKLTVLQNAKREIEKHPVNIRYNRIVQQIIQVQGEIEQIINLQP